MARVMAALCALALSLAVMTLPAHARSLAQVIPHWAGCCIDATMV